MIKCVHPLYPSALLELAEEAFSHDVTLSMSYLLALPSVSLLFVDVVVRSMCVHV